MRAKRGRLGRTVGAVADSIASATRRPPRGTRVVVYDRNGHATVLKPETELHERLSYLASEIVELAGTPPEAAPEAESDPSD
jgi:hypothetical protein